ncbi:unnamed protein product [Trichogramma brassicae]|uniref:Uncharacterized protein n=1 Tax=Trichogramma brassicae TaxID=86971 RepID=A0A6H5J3H9_9HYME|nr:unnamed protein product [Trichogramma brassicae]
MRYSPSSAAFFQIRSIQIPTGVGGGSASIIRTSEKVQKKKKKNKNCTLRCLMINIRTNKLYARQPSKRARIARKVRKSLGIQFLPLCSQQLYRTRYKVIPLRLAVDSERERERERDGRTHTHTAAQQQVNVAFSAIREGQGMTDTRADINPVRERRDNVL